MNSSTTYIRQNEHQALTLPDQRKLGYTEYGKTTGFPVFALHGTPGSRIWFEENDEVAEVLDIHLITIDRPGFGISDPKPRRTLVDLAEDIAALADHLGLDTFAVMGISGGGVYAAATGYVLRERVSRVAMISTTSEFVKGKPPKDMVRVNRSSFILAKRFPWLLNVSLKQQKKLLDHHPAAYQKAIQQNVAHLCPADQAVIAQPENAAMMCLHMQEAFRQGVAEVLRELRLLSKPWGFSGKDILSPLDIWHGTEDTLAPVRAMQTFAQAVPGANCHFLEGKGHFISEDLRIWEKILRSLKN